LSGAGSDVSVEFVRETRDLMLRRATVGVILGLSIFVAFVGVDYSRIAPAGYPRVLLFRVAGMMLLLALLAATQARSALRWSHAIGGAALTIMIATTASIISVCNGPSDPQYVTQGTGLVLCILGGGLLLPFDAPGMLVLGLVAIAFHVGLTLDFPLLTNFPVLFGTVSSVAIATVGARELTRSRLADFEGRRAKEDLLRVRSDFVAMLTHDIKNPLAVIDGFVEMLCDEPEMAPAKRADLLAHVRRSVRNAITLAVNFLDASKIEADRFVLRTRLTDVRDVLQRTVVDHLPMAAQKGVTLRNDAAADLPPVDADSAALALVFANLVGNAIKHTGDGGVVRMATHLPEPDRIEIVIEDSGEGIPAGEESRIFERYTGAASRADSTGLGLFIARTITTAHGGSISAENRSECRGARFRVILPVAERSPNVSTPQPGR
jgi:signal transduction histidine kinase